MGELVVNVRDPRELGYGDRRLLSMLSQDKLRRVLAYLLDENEFLSPHGIRALSRYHAEHPYIFQIQGQEYRVRLPAGRVEHRHVWRQLQLARAWVQAIKPAGQAPLPGSSNSLDP